MITASFKNSSPFAKHWTVKDGHTNQAVVDQDFEGEEVVEAELDASDAGYGEVYYKHPDVTLWSHISLVADGQEVDMY